MSKTTTKSAIQRDPPSPISVDFSFPVETEQIRNLPRNSINTH
jgi:hypothetical protein